MKLRLLTALLIFTAFSAVAETPAVSLYPNPAGAQVSISFSDMPATDVSVVISDILGNKIETFTFRSNESISIDLAALRIPNGMYIFKITTGTAVYTKRLSVKNA